MPWHLFEINKAYTLDQVIGANFRTTNGGGFTNRHAARKKGRRNRSFWTSTNCLEAGSLPVSTVPFGMALMGTKGDKQILVDHVVRYELFTSNSFLTSNL